MLFEKKDDNPEKIRVVDTEHHSGWKWVTIYKGDQIDLAEDHGLKLGLVPVEKKEGSGKADSEDPFKKKLISIKGIGKKTAEDILEIYSNEPDLVNALKSGEDIPIRDDLAELLKKKFK